MKKVIIPTKNDQQLVCSLFYPEKIKDLPVGRQENPAVMFIPGWTSNESSYHERAKAISNLGYICLAVTLRGHGESSGELSEFSRADHLEDVMHAYDFLKSQKNVDQKNISIVGASYGGYLAAILAGKRVIQNLALRAPAFYYNNDFEIPTAQLINNSEEEFFQHVTPEKNNWALEGIKKIKGKLLLIESEKDQIIPHKIILLYKDAATTPVEHKIIRFSDHQLSKGEWKQEFITLLISWYQTLKK